MVRYKVVYLLRSEDEKNPLLIEKSAKFESDIEAIAFVKKVRNISNLVTSPILEVY